ncbi:hypothetical protein ACFWHR_00810 [Leucobacter sp. NPDC058333]|uniref:hypothetical protein n=1 Tax=Leucobacter sp. NPDC058333 TaxID=3346450 RepID=UPI003649580A
MGKKKIGAAVFGTVMAAAAACSAVPTAAIAAASLTIEKTSSVDSTLVGDTVEFTVTISGPAGTYFNAQDRIAGYADNTAAPAVTAITPAPGYSAMSTSISMDNITVSGYLDDSGMFVYTYSVLVDAVGDAVLESEGCVYGQVPTRPTRPTRPTDPTVVPPIEEIMPSVSGEETVVESAETESVAAESDETADVPVLASEVQVMDAIGNCFNHEVAITVPETPVTPENPTEPEVPGGTEVPQDPEQPAVQTPEQPTVPAPAPATAPVVATGAKTAALAHTGAEDHTAAAAGAAVGLTAVGAGLIALRRKFRQSQI